MLYATFKTQVFYGLLKQVSTVQQVKLYIDETERTQVLNENARKPLSIGYLAFSLCSDILIALSVF